MPHLLVRCCDRLRPQHRLSMTVQLWQILLYLDCAAVTSWRAAGIDSSIEDWVYKCRLVCFRKEKQVAVSSIYPVNVVLH